MTKRSQALTQKFILTVAVLGGFALFLSSCDRAPESTHRASRLDTTPETTPGPQVTAAAAGSFGNVYQVLVRNNCVDCHSPSGAATSQNGVGLDFSSRANMYSTLTSLSVTGATSAGICAGVRIVTPGNARSSYLAGVLIASYHSDDFGGVAGCTPYSVHLQDTNLSADDQQTLINWIQSGAPNN